MATVIDVTEQVFLFLRVVGLLKATQKLSVASIAAVLSCTRIYKHATIVLKRIFVEVMSGLMMSCAFHEDNYMQRYSPDPFSIFT